ncbi:uncharacterized protein DEA37_0014056 [Paragonimus westermani]|uniref:Mitotic spindle assembly checkpoint protein MAD1 n=1 Tax=Paragonimus westermani TaxID=34504 RepID=A0A5J4NDM4_9TREM|nr:uncharacterized protein DEA37_0014056 [Paragonimus westermani]
MCRRTISRLHIVNTRTLDRSKISSICELEQVVALRHRIAELETQLSQLEGKLENVEVKVLEDCISRLNKTPKILENADESAGGVTMVVNQRLQDNPDPLTELEEVREQLRVERLRSDRLMEMFDKASAKFRGACRDLLGYRVDVNPSDEYKVRSVFTNSPHEFVQFKRINGKFELQDTKYTLGLPPHVRSFLTTNQSIPGFFAALTSSYLQQDTMIL